jgi:hypothetical protein
MSSIPSRIETITTSRILTWLHILGAALVVVVTALYGAVHSPLGQEISAG